MLFVDIKLQFALNILLIETLALNYVQYVVHKQHRWVMNDVFMHEEWDYELVRLDLNTFHTWITISQIYLKFSFFPEVTLKGDLFPYSVIK